MASSIVATINHDKHRQRRAPLDKFFSKKSIRDLDPLIAEKLDIICSRFTRALQTGEVVNLSIIFSALTLDVITTYCFGASFGAVSSPDWGNSFRDIFNAGAQSLKMQQHFPWMGTMVDKLPLWLLTYLMPQMSKMQVFYGLIDESITKVEKTHGTPDEDQLERRTIFHDVLESSLPPEEKTHKRLLDDGIVVVGAGMETTARTLAVLMFYICSDRAVHRKLLEELRGAMATPLEYVDSSQLEQLPYLVCGQPCVCEAMDTDHSL
jgi:cytochrome P450